MIKTRGKKRRTRASAQAYPEYKDYTGNCCKMYNDDRLPISSYHYVMLDGPKLNSAKSRIAAGILPENIHIIERDRKTYKKMKLYAARHSLNINLYLGNISDRISNIKHKIGVLYLDFMGNLGDVDDFYKTLETCKDQLEKNSTIVVTFSARFRKKNYTAEKFINKLQDGISVVMGDRKIQPTLIRGYKRDEDPKASVSTTMMFLTFSVDGPETEPLYRPRKIVDEKVVGSRILKRMKVGVDHIDPDKYYDQVVWWLYPKKTTWEPHGSILKD